MTTVPVQNMDRPRVVPVHALTYADLCDRCNASVMVRIAVSGMILDFCGHHYNDHKEALADYPVLEDRRG